MIAYPIHEEHYAAVADVEAGYNVTPKIDYKELDKLIDKAREDMERAAKSQDFLAAIRYRDKMYELQKLRDGRE
jgi:excinuclease ABC subunit B